MRDIKQIVIHCSAGSQRQHAADIVRYHTSPAARGGLGWSAPGYHYIVEADGTVVHTWPEDRPSNGVRGHNATSVNVCYTGGVDLSRPRPYPAVDNRTPAQRAAIRRLLSELHGRYPAARIMGHRDFPGVHKACPCFDAITEYNDLQP
ncbi:MAG: N-acetylmuramoyl-L-alanine amidase [Muribaculaceae bacterium]|nr:N-acetylmuramoyl-L-alanine amidase [Muribaculaceae bacterium]